MLDGCTVTLGAPPVRANSLVSSLLLLLLLFPLLLSIPLSSPPLFSFSRSLYFSLAAAVSMRPRLPCRRDFELKESVKRTPKLLRLS